LFMYPEMFYGRPCELLSVMYVCGEDRAGQ